MEILSKLSGHWMELAVIVYLVGMILYGHHKGFIRLAVSATALIITLFAVNYAMPHVTEWVKNDTPIYETMKTKMAEKIGVDEILSQLGLEDMTEKTDEQKMIEMLPLPEQMKNLLVENNNIEVYEQMGVKLFRDYIGGYLADTVLKAAIFAILFLVVFLALQIAVVWLDLIAKLPILSGINQIAGAVLGGVQAMIFIWIVCIVLTIFSGTQLGSSALAQIDASPWLSLIYDHNILANMVLGLVRSIL